MEQFDTALQKKAKLYEALYYKGLVYLDRDEKNQAKKTFDSGIKKAKEEKALFHDGMGLYYLKTKEYSLADVQFRKASQVGPDLPEFHAHLGDANYFSEIYPLAINEYERALEMDTTNLDIYFRLARSYVALGQYAEALNQLSVVLSRDNTYDQAWKQAGKLYTMAGLLANGRDLKEQRFKEAIGSYRKYIDLSKDSTDGEVFFNLGRSYFNLGGFQQADSAFEYVLAIGDVPKSIYLYLGRGYMGEERYREGIETLDKHFEWLKEQDPDWKPTVAEADLYRRIGDAYKELDDNLLAAESYVKALEVGSRPQRAPRWRWRGLLPSVENGYPDALPPPASRPPLGPHSATLTMPPIAPCTQRTQL